MGKDLNLAFTAACATTAMTAFSYRESGKACDFREPMLLAELITYTNNRPIRVLAGWGIHYLAGALWTLALDRRAAIRSLGNGMGRCWRRDRHRRMEFAFPAASPPVAETRTGILSAPVLGTPGFYGGSQGSTLCVCAGIAR